MKREVVQEFLSLPGIMSVALMDGRSRPCFYGVDERLNSQQREALAQGICQVIDTTPASCNTFELQFVGIRAYLYKLPDSLVLMILVDDQFQPADYRKAVVDFKTNIEGNVNTAIATLRYLAGTQSRSKGMAAKGAGTATGKTGRDITTRSPSGLPTQSGLGHSGATPDTQSLSGGTQTYSGRNTVKGPGPDPENLGVLRDYLNTMNELSKFAKKYLGTAVIVNYWKSSRPHVKWLDGFQIERSGQISCLAENTQLMQQGVNAQQQKWLQEWVKSFVKRCATVIRDFPRLAEAESLTPRQKEILPLE